MVWLAFISILANKMAAADVYLLCWLNFALPKCCFHSGDFFSSLAQKK